MRGRRWDSRGGGGVHHKSPEAFSPSILISRFFHHFLFFLYQLCVSTPPPCATPTFFSLILRSRIISLSVSSPLTTRSSSSGLCTIYIKGSFFLRCLPPFFLILLAVELLRAICLDQVVHPIHLGHPTPFAHRCAPAKESEEIAPTWIRLYKFILHDYKVRKWMGRQYFTVRGVIFFKNSRVMG